MLEDFVTIGVGIAMIWWFTYFLRWWLPRDSSYWVDYRTLFRVPAFYVAISLYGLSLLLRTPWS